MQGNVVSLESAWLMEKGGILSHHPGIEEPMD
ncbi:MAG: hypothetical protein A4E39_01999 [Methanoregulaceae archaeon PtaB.Bin152]|nr:MAG: hypothetical protein A4E39_01999 [Methanoregulaceae archaeon PtaB.Bin152]